MPSKMDRSSSTAIKLRKKIGGHLQRLRQGVELTQVQVAERLGYQYFTFVAQIEQGRARVPPEDWMKWAKLYKQEPKAFSRTLLKHYDPHVFEACFGSKGEENEGHTAVSKLHGD